MWTPPSDSAVRGYRSVQSQEGEKIMMPVAAFFTGVFVTGVMVVIGFWLDNIQNTRLIRRFREVVFYGPFNCERCGKMITQAEVEKGGRKYEYPCGIIYPNVEWRPHVCFTREDFDRKFSHPL
jgi:hypothetical protein